VKASRTGPGAGGRAFDAGRPLGAAEREVEERAFEELGFEERVFERVDELLELFEPDRVGDLVATGVRVPSAPAPLAAQKGTAPAGSGCGTVTNPTPDPDRPLRSPA